MEKLPIEKLYKKCNIDNFNFKTTAEVIPLDDIIGQDRAVKAMNFGLRVKSKGYNIYMAGLTGTGKTSYAKSIVKKIAAEGHTPDDWCYVYNFSQPDYPRAISLPAGYGEKFVEEMDNMIEEFREEIPKTLDSEEFENKKREIGQNYQNQSNKMLQELDKWAKEKEFTIQRTSKGVYLVPIIDGEPADQQKLNSLPEEEAEEIQNKLPEVQKEFDKVLRKIRNLEKQTFEEMEALEKEFVLSVVEPEIEKLKCKYETNNKIKDYLDSVKEDIIDNLHILKKTEEDNNPLNSFLPVDKHEEFFKRYKVNLFVNNSNTKGAPVIIESNPTYYNLFGKIEGKPQFATITMDFTDIKSGAIHQANGGFLIVYALDILKEPFAWDALKRTLQNEESNIENIGEQFKLYPTETIKPEPIPIKLKVILIGSTQIQQLLHHYDEDFRKLFKIKAQFDVEMEMSEENINKYAAFIASICKREKLPHFDRSGVASVVEFSSRLAGDQEKLSTRFNEVAEIIYESCAWATLQNSSIVTAKHVQHAIKEKEFRSNLLEEKIQEMIETGEILVDTEGKVIGQVNGLSVYELGDYSFGRPSRITARTFLGESGVVNIEREAKLSGKIHDKGILILSGYLGGKYAKDTPLTVAASICFEQNYSGVDGDSASCAELAALLSSIGEIPIKQGIAITGSLNQKGEVQPIGGVNEKITGFYEVCKVKGFTGEQGVIIPEQNVRNLMLKQEIVAAVNDNKFTIYSVKNIDEALELLTGMPASEIHQRVQEKLNEMYENVKQHDNN
jgi:lon-related putative ATP-dependent protease